MKLAWLVWEDGSTIFPQIKFKDPEIEYGSFFYHRVVQIVYTEIKD